MLGIDEAFSFELGLNLLTQVHPSLRRSLSRVNVEVDCRLGDSDLSRCSRLDSDNLVLSHFRPQLQRFLEVGTTHLPPARDLASGMVTLKRSRNEQVDSAIPAGSQIGIDASNLFGEEFLRQSQRRLHPGHYLHRKLSSSPRSRMRTARIDLRWFSLFRRFTSSERFSSYRTSRDRSDVFVPSLKSSRSMQRIVAVACQVSPTRLCYPKRIAQSRKSSTMFSRKDKAREQSRSGN